MQQKLAKREGGSIDRSLDIARLQEFYRQYREKNNVDMLREEQLKLRESGVFSGNLGEYVLYLYSELVILNAQSNLLDLYFRIYLIELHNCFSF